MSRNTAFTLVEILVVVAIIALLAAILFAVQAPAREKARQTVCMNNLKQIGIALQMYRADWSATDPEQGVQRTAEELGLPPIGDVELQPYLRDKRVWFCNSRWADPYWTDVEGLMSSYQTMWWDDNCPVMHDFGWRFFREVIADQPAWPVLQCPFHDPLRWKRGLVQRQADRVLGMSVDGSVRWWSKDALDTVLYRRR